MSENLPPPPPPGATPPPSALTPGMAPDGRHYASWGARVLAYVIDYIGPWVLALIGAMLGWPRTEIVHRDLGGYSYTVTETTGFGVIYFVCILIGLVFAFWNKGFREGTTGKSIGKQITGYTTLNEQTNQPLGFGMGVARWLLLWIDFAICYIGVLWPLWDPKRQCLLSDRITGAVVYKD
ncbi:MAG: RDD family protein [Candidatus Nanopelagicales bacterium]|nr:RDD family protein [Candidatus Nanopelagicales bacterium]